MKQVEQARTQAAAIKPAMPFRSEASPAAAGCPSVAHNGAVSGFASGSAGAAAGGAAGGAAVAAAGMAAASRGGSGGDAGPIGTRPQGLLVQVSRAVLEEASRPFPASGKTYPLAISRLFGGRMAFTFHACNAATPANPTAINLILASDVSDPDNDIILNDLDNQTLSIFGNHTGDRFEITRISAVHRRVGTGSNRSLKLKLSLHLKSGPGVTCLRPALYRQIASLPNSRVQTAANSQRIGHWDKYLEINENIARSAEAILTYRRLHINSASLQVTFILSDGAIEARCLGSNIQLVTDETIEDGQPSYQGPQIGTIQAFDARIRELTVDMDAEFQALRSDGRFRMPDSGRLFVSQLGDLVQIRRLRNGLKAFARGQAENPRLDSFLFDAGQARLPATGSQAVRLADGDLLQPGLNPEQRRAVEGALASPDLFLIQGPPGTGKTTVIAEICYQNAVRGLRTLIASQTNLAVDNALGKLVHHPRIRALRKGNEASVQPEGLRFVEGQVIATWLGQTASASARKLAELTAADAQLKVASRQVPDLAWTHAALRRLSERLRESEPAIAELQQRNAALDQKYRLLDSAFDRFMRDPAGPAFSVLSAHADGFDTPTLTLIGRVNAAAVQYAGERSRVESAEIRFRAVCHDLDRLVLSLQKRLARVTRRSGTASSRSRTSDSAAHRDSVAHRDATAYRDSAAHRDSVALMQESGFEFSLDDHLQQAERLRRELVRLGRTAPGFLRILFGWTGDWAVRAEDRLALARWLSASSDRIVRAEQARVESIFDNPAVADAIRTLADTFRRCREEMLMTLNGNLSAIDTLQEQISHAHAEQAIARRRIDAYHAALAGLAALPAVDAVAAATDDAAVTVCYEAALTAARRQLAARRALITAWADRIRRPDAADSAALKQLYIDSANVIGITCSQSGSHAFSSQYPSFDVAIIDEVSKATPPELILPVLKAKRIVLVGDHRQLPPMVGMETYEEIAQELGIPEAETEHMKAGLFAELFTQAPPPLRLMLSTQYRMHPQIMETINQFYSDGGGLRCGISEPDQHRSHGCHGRALGSGDHALWVDLPQTPENRERRAETGHSCLNHAEAACIRQILLTLSANLRVNDPAARKQVGVISFYAAQVRLLETQLLDPAFAARVPNLILRIGSVDRFQGIECPIVICSFVRNNDRGDIGFARDPRRVNVALSRAQELSVIVGCSALFCDGNGSDEAAAIYRTVAERIREHGGFRHALDFA